MKEKKKTFKEDRKKERKNIESKKIWVMKERKKELVAREKKAKPKKEIEERKKIWKDRER